MKKFLTALTLSSVISTTAFAECDFKKGITENANGTFTYTGECHLKVGQMKQDLETKDVQIEKLLKAIDFKDLAIAKADQRWEQWRNTSFEMQDKLQSYDSFRRDNQVLYFAAGILFTGLAVWGAGQLR